MAGTDYEFPAAAIDAASYVAVLQAELRAIAARLVMPEFMFTSDASNANYSSTMVAEGPAVKMFDRLQRDMIEDDIELLFRVVGHAVVAGRLPADALSAVDIRAIAPTLAVRDRLRRRPGGPDSGSQRGDVAGDDGHASRPRSGPGGASRRFGRAVAGRRRAACKRAAGFIP